VHEEKTVDDLINDLLERINLKARSLLVTVWGDSVAPHGGTVWLGSLIELVESLGLNERVVRTSVFRLKQEKLLDSHQKGRRSFYTLTHSGLLRFEEATKRIYNPVKKPWDGNWTLLFTERRALSEEQRRQIQMELVWLGFGDMGSGIYAHPGGDLDALEKLIRDLDLEDNITLMRAATLPSRLSSNPQILIQKGWNIPLIEGGYKEFITNFRPVLIALKNNQNLSAKKCFILRTLLVHDYRRALLKDPVLPATLLPENWSGNVAQNLFRDIYKSISPGAENYLMQILETTTGKLPQASEEFRSRFGGLES